MPRIAPEIFRKRLLIEGYFARQELDAAAIRDYFTVITSRLGLRTYGEPTVHTTSGQGKAANEGYDAFVPTHRFGDLCMRLVGTGLRVGNPLHLRRVRRRPGDRDDPRLLRAHRMGDGTFLVRSARWRPTPA